jgi:23S rRNA pseudouridine1911/1915/1917 synthase
MPSIVASAFSLKAEEIDLPTLFEDEHLWVINKPPGIVVHPSQGHASGTILNALLWRLKKQVLTTNTDCIDENEIEDEATTQLWPGLVHRLDHYTTGCLVMAKDVESQRALQLQFKNRTIKKHYLAITKMSNKLPAKGSINVDQPIARHRSNRLKMAASNSGRPSQTRVELLAQSCGLALVECEPKTGRTHQIRLHLSCLNAPILGDTLYGGSKAWLDINKRPLLCPHALLHAWKISINHPISGCRMDFIAPLPDFYKDILGRLNIPLPCIE